MNRILFSIELLILPFKEEELTFQRAWISKFLLLLFKRITKVGGRDRDPVIRSSFTGSACKINRPIVSLAVKLHEINTRGRAR